MAGKEKSSNKKSEPKTQTTASKTSRDTAEQAGLDQNQLAEQLPIIQNIEGAGDALTEERRPLLREKDVIQLQKQVGNIRTQQFIQRAVDSNRIQRVQVTSAAASETLHNEVDSATGQFKSNNYRVGTRGVNYEGQGINYEMLRKGSGVIVNVKIKFVALFGSSTAAATPIPEGQPRTTARSICTQLLQYWNTSNRFELSGVRQPAWYESAAESMGVGSSAASREIHLPVQFKISPVFDLAADAHATVQLDTVNSGNAGAGRVVNASHWYSTLDPASYSGGVADTYAHEFGHLLGIPDEYSLGNPAAHDLMHQISTNPATRATMDEAIDAAGVREMILAAIRPAIQSRLRSQAADLSVALQGQKNQMIQLLSERIRSAWGDASVLTAVGDQVRTQLDTAGQTRMSDRVDRILRFQTGRNLSNLGIARQVVPAELNPTQLASLLSSLTAEAAESAQQGTINVPYQNEVGRNASVDVNVNVAPGVSQAGSPLAASAAQAATASVGAPTTPGSRGTSAIYPSNTLMSQLQALPGTWADLAAQMATVLSEMPDVIDETVTNMLGATNISGNVNNSVRNLYTELYNLVNNAAIAVSQTTMRNFLGDEIYPLIDQQLADIMTMVEAETARHTTATGTGTNAAPGAPVIPGLMAAVQQMQATARTMLNPAAPVAGGTAQQNVTYTMQTLMGANSEGTSLRGGTAQRDRRPVQQQPACSAA